MKIRRLVKEGKTTQEKIDKLNAYAEEKPGLSRQIQGIIGRLRELSKPLVDVSGFKHPITPNVLVAKVDGVPHMYNLKAKKPPRKVSNANKEKYAKQMFPVDYAKNPEKFRGQGKSIKQADGTKKIVRYT